MSTSLFTISLKGPDGANHQLQFKDGRYTEKVAKRKAPRFLTTRLDRLQEWYAAQCETGLEVILGPDQVYHHVRFRSGRFYEVENALTPTPWQDRYGIRIHTVAASAWQVTIDLSETSLDKVELPVFKKDDGKGRWLNCGIKEKKFLGTADPSQLTAIIDQFLQLERHHTNQVNIEREVLQEDQLNLLQEWFALQAMKGWKDKKDLKYGVSIGTADNPCWSVSIDLIGTVMDRNTMSLTDFNKSEYDWFTCQIINNRFHGVGDPSKLAVMLNIFLGMMLKSV